MELFWVRKEMKGYFCLSQRTSEWRLPSLQTQIWWRRVCLLSPCAHCWGCSALLTCTNAAYIKAISPPCMWACAACTAVSVCMHRSSHSYGECGELNLLWLQPVVSLQPPFVSLLLFVTPKLDSAVTAWSELWRSRFTFTLFICPETVCLKQVYFVPSGCWLYISRWE